MIHDIGSGLEAHTPHALPLKADVVNWLSDILFTQFLPFFPLYSRSCHSSLDRTLLRSIWLVPYPTPRVMWLLLTCIVWTEKTDHEVFSLTFSRKKTLELLIISPFSFRCPSKKLQRSNSSPINSNTSTGRFKVRLASPTQFDSLSPSRKFNRFIWFCG